MSQKSSKIILSKNIKIDKKELGAWKIEADWSEGYFFRKKGYIEKEKESKKYIS